MSDDKYRWITDAIPVMPFDYADIEKRIQDKIQEKQRRINEMYHERDMLGRWVSEGAMTGRFTISQPRPQFKWQTGPAGCQCGLCRAIYSGSASGEEVTTPYHPVASVYANNVRIRNRRAAEAEWYEREKRSGALRDILW